MRCVILSVATFLLAISPSLSFAEEVQPHTVDGNFVCDRDIVRTFSLKEVAPEQMELREPTAARRATTIVLNAGPGLSANASALAAWNDAVDLWESVLGDNLSVEIDGDLAALGPGVLGSTNSALFSGAGYTAVRNQIVADRAGDEGIVTSLPTAAQVSVTLPASGFAYGNDITASRALLEAIGYDPESFDPGGVDAVIKFSTGFLSSFDFDPTNGITAGKLDFFAIVVHEIGHALGFSSNVDLVDFCVANPASCPGTIGVNPMALDLFRIGAGQGGNFTLTNRILTHGGQVPVQVFNDGLVERLLSTGAYNGNGSQASHWWPDEQSGTTIGLMDPTIGGGQLGKLTNSDVRAFGLIGWDVNYLADCNGNDIGDQFDIWAGDEDDINMNGVPDSCEATAAPKARNATVVIAPNPFNPRTEIKLTLSEEMRGRVSVYDLAGRHVATLAEQGFGVGTHSVIWEGKDNAGRGVSSGVYFVLVDLDGEVQRHKVALVR